jgi:hypothetical protein
VGPGACSDVYGKSRLPTGIRYLDRPGRSESLETNIRTFTVFFCNSEYQFFVALFHFPLSSPFPSRSTSEGEKGNYSSFQMTLCVCRPSGDMLIDR